MQIPDQAALLGLRGVSIHTLQETNGAVGRASGSCWLE